MRPHKASRRTTDRQTAEVWRRIEAQGGGVYNMAFFTPFELSALLAKALAGDGMAAAQVKVIDQMLATINDAHSRSGAPGCLLCGSAVWRHRLPARIGVVSAACDAPTEAMAHVICRDCERRYPTADSFNAQVVASYREHVMSDARLLAPASPPGHA